MKVSYGLILVWFLFFQGLASTAGAASADDFYHNASYMYIEGKMDRALLETEAGLKQFPGDQKLQMLKERIEEVKESQQDKQQQQNKQNQDQQDQKEKQEKDSNQKGEENQDQEQEQGEEKEQQEEKEEQDQQDSTQNQDPEQPEESEEDPEDQKQQDTLEQMEAQEQTITPEQAKELLENFNEKANERPKWKPSGKNARPQKDW